MGCSTSEVVGSKIGTNFNPDVAGEMFDALHDYTKVKGIYLAIQCCEHLNRAIITERKAVPFAEPVNVVPHSGNHRRAYAAIYNKDGEYVGIVTAIMLAKNIHSDTMQMLLIFGAITLLAIAIELVIAGSLSKKVKTSLMGYEPDVFAAMYKMCDNILETLEEGIIATDENGIIQFANDSAIKMLCKNPFDNIVGKNIEILGDEILTSVMRSGGKETNVNLSNTDIILDRISIKETGGSKGAIGVLHDRAEYTKLMEDLSGTRYLVDSMRANNHDFTNKLHVILSTIIKL